MIGVDTNVLLRVLVDDPGAAGQCARARDLVARSDRVFITTVVLVETIRVLQRGYGVNRSRVQAILQQLLQQKMLVFENRPLVEQALGLFQASRYDFSDTLILACNQKKSCVLHTFDRTLGKQAGACLLK